VKMFMWRIAHNSLAVRRNLAKRGIKKGTRCPMCSRLDEDCGHLFLKCKYVKECWRSLNLEDYRQLLLPCRSVTDLLNMIWSFPLQVQMIIIVLLWRWWSARNKTNAGEEKMTSSQVCSLVTYYVQDFEKLKKNSEKGQPARITRWEAPPQGTYKISTDAAFSAATSQGGWGYVVRDDEGSYLDGDCGKLSRVASPLQGEALAALFALERASNLGMSRIILETNATELKKALTTTNLDRSVEGCLFMQIRSFMNASFDH
jgi:hypothetical protein